MLATYPWQASEAYRRSHQREMLRLVTDAQPGTMARPSRRDMPVSYDFNKRVYGMRAVEYDVVRLPQATDHDPMNELDN